MFEVEELLAAAEEAGPPQGEFNPAQPSYKPYTPGLLF